MLDPLVVTLSLSICFQIGAAYLALRLIPLTGHRSAWVYIALAAIAMAVRRIIVLIYTEWVQRALPVSISEITGLVISVCLFVGMVSIRGFFERAHANDAALRRSESHLRTVFDLPLVGIASSDGARRFAQVNDKLCDMFGFSRAELLRMPLEALAHPDDRARLTGAFNDLFAGATTSVVLEMRFLRKTEEVMHAGVSARLVRNGGEPYYVAIFNDVTERTRAEAAREELVTKLQSEVSKVKALSGLLPICASCKKIRDDTGYWNQVETYLVEHSDMTFSHGICPDCARKMYPEVFGR